MTDSNDNCQTGNAIFIGAGNALPSDHNVWEIAHNALKVRQGLGLLTEDEVAAVLSLKSTGTLATWRSQSSGPDSVKLGKTVFYTVNGLAGWINDQAQKQFAAKQLVAQAIAA